MLKRHYAKRQEQKDKRPRFTTLDKKLLATPKKPANQTKTTSTTNSQQDKEIPHCIQPDNQLYSGQWHMPHPTHTSMPSFPLPFIQPSPFPLQYSHQYVPPPIVAPSFPPMHSKNHNNHFIPPDLWF